MGALDEHVGLRLVQLRSDRGLSSWELAATLGMSIEDIELVESGQRRLRASELLVLCRKYRVPISYFFEGVETGLLTDDVLGQFLDARSKAKIR